MFGGPECVGPEFGSVSLHLSRSCGGLECGPFVGCGCGSLNRSLICGDAQLGGLEYGTGVLRCSLRSVLQFVRGSVFHFARQLEAAVSGPDIDLAGC